MSMKVGEAGNRQPQPVPNTPDNVLKQFGMTGKVVAVNGAADGIGYAVAAAMVEVGANVAMWYNTNSEAVSKAAALTEKFGVKVKAYQVQVTDPRKVEEAIRQVVKDFGKLDVFVANVRKPMGTQLVRQSADRHHRASR
jgi:sorbose reductase